MHASDILDRLIDSIETKGRRKISTHRDKLNPVLYKSAPLKFTQEQEDAIRDVLYLASSDTRFAQKAALAIRIILQGGANVGVVPEITSLSPNTAAIPDPVNSSDTVTRITVHGKGFDSSATILVDEVPVNTTFTSDTELFTEVSLSTAVEGEKQVAVQNSTTALSNQMTFTVTPFVPVGRRGEDGRKGELGRKEDERGERK